MMAMARNLNFVVWLVISIGGAILYISLFVLVKNAYRKQVTLETERKNAEDELKESEIRYRFVVQSAIDAIVSTDAKGKIISWNNGAQNIFGYAESEVLGKKLTILMPERFREDHTIGLENHLAT